MESDLEILRKSLSLFHEDDNGLHLKNCFNDVDINLRINTKIEKVIQDGSALFQHVIEDIWNISIIIDRISWLREMAAEGKLDDNNWRDYTKVDIDAFSRRGSVNNGLCGRNNIQIFE